VAIAGTGLLVPEVKTVWFGVIWGRESEEMRVLSHKFDYSIQVARNSVEMVLGSMWESLATAVVDCKSRRLFGGLEMVFVGAGIEDFQELEFAGCSRAVDLDLVRSQFEDALRIHHKAQRGRNKIQQTAGSCSGSFAGAGRMTGEYAGLRSLRIQFDSVSGNLGTLCLFL
jgi:hypothetical protein